MNPNLQQAEAESLNAEKKSEKKINASTSSQQEDLITIEKSKKNRNAFCEIIKKYQNRIFKTIYSMVNNYTEASDLTQDTFLRAHENLNSYKEMASFYTWLTRIAINITIDQLRQKKSKPKVLTIHSQDNNRPHPTDIDPPSPNSNPVSTTTINEQINIVREAIDELDDIDKPIIILKDIQGHDYQEISDILSIPLGTVRSRLHRARLSLKDILKKKHLF